MITKIVNQKQNYINEKKSRKKQMNKIVIFSGPRNVLGRCKSILYGKLISTQETKESEKHMNKQI